MAISSALATRSEDCADSLLVLRSTWNGARMGKAFRCGPDGRLAQPDDYRLGKLFVPEVIPLRGIDDLHAAWSRLAMAGDAFCVRGGLSGRYVSAGTRVGRSGSTPLRCDHVTRRNGGVHADGLAGGLTDASRHWLFLDMDKVANVLRLDPCTQPEAALEFLLGLLPPTVVGATVSWNWSSSMCVGLEPGTAPDRLSAHLRIWLDRAIDGQGTRALLEHLREFAWSRLAGFGVVRDGGHDNVVDWKVAEPQQPMYIAAPQFGDGLADPFPGEARRGIRRGCSDILSLDELERVLPAKVLNPRSQARREPGPVSTEKVRTVHGRMERVAAEPPGDAAVVPFMAAGRLLKAQQRSRCRSLADRLTADRRLFAARVLLEVVRLVRGRVERGATEHRWRAWHQAGGVPEGQRDMVVFLVGCLVAESLEVEELTEGRINEAILEIGRLVVDGAWLREDWMRGRYWSALVRRAIADGQGEDEVWEGTIRSKGFSSGHLKSKGYWVGKARMLRELGVLPEEVARYGLRSLATDRDRLAAERLGDGATSRAEVQARNRIKARTARQLMAKGASLRQAAQEVALDPSQLSRLLRAQTASAESPQPDSTRSAHVHLGVDSSSASRGKLGEQEKEEDFSPSPSVETPLTVFHDAPAVTAATEPCTELLDAYAATVAACSKPGANGIVDVEPPPPEADGHVHLGYAAALEAAGAARSRTAARLRRLQGPAAERRRFYDGLLGLAGGEVRSRLVARRQAVAMAQREARLAAVGAGKDTRALALLDLGHRRDWSLENKAARRILGGRAPARTSRGTAYPAVSKEWRAAVRHAEALATLSAGERLAALAARAETADSAQERADLTLLRRALGIVLARPPSQLAA